MKKYRIEIEINEDGDILAETKGMEGKVCVSELNNILAGLGEQQEVKKKPEYYKKQTITQRAKIKK
jgi:hypothetical protein